MTLSAAISRVRKITRTSALSHTDTEVMNAINEGIREWSKDAKGNIKETYISLAPRFDSGTNWALVMSAAGASASFAVTATSRLDATAGTVAADLQTAIRAATTAWATATVSWSTTNWQFSIHVASATTVSISAPSQITYVDASDMVLGGGNEQDGSTWTSTLPRDCLIEADLPSDFMTVHHVQWDRTRVLDPIEFSHVVASQVHGTPTHYHIVNRRLRLYPSPNRQKLLHFWYKAKYPEYTSVTASATVDIPLDPPYDDAVVFYAASAVAEENDEVEKANLNRAKYREQVQFFNVHFANQNPRKAEPKGFVFPQWILVDEN